MKTKGLFFLIFAFSTCLIGLGCGKTGSMLSSGPFESSPPEIKATWEKSVAADQTNDYVDAVLGYKSIIRQQDTLKPEQVQAVQDASGKLFQRLVDASTKGDAAARQALATLGAMQQAR